MYKCFYQALLRVTLFDMIKHWLMPSDKYEVSCSVRLQGFAFYSRLFAAGALCSGLQLAITYPLDLVHTRMVADMSVKGQTKVYPSFFKTFNYTNVDEKRAGLYKGSMAAVGYSAFNAMLFPIYEIFRQQEGYLGQGYARIGASACTAIVTSTLLYPLDTVKRCMQLSGARNTSFITNSYADAFAHLKKGVRAPSGEEPLSTQPGLASSATCS